MPEPPYSALFDFWGEESPNISGRAKITVPSRRGISLTRTGEGGLVQDEGRHEEKVKVLLFHMANKPTATVVARKPSATIHRTRGVVGIMSVCFLFVLSLSFPDAGPRSSREGKKKKKVYEKRLGQEAADTPRLLCPLPEQTLLELSRGEGGSPEHSWAGGNSGSRFCSLG